MTSISPLERVLRLRRDLAAARRAARWRRRVLGTGLAVVSAALVACDTDRPPGRPSAFAVDGPATGTTARTVPADTSPDTPASFDDPPAIPDDDLGAGGAALVVSPGPMVLGDGGTSASLTVTNGSDEDVDWTAATAAFGRPH